MLISPHTPELDTLLRQWIADELSLSIDDLNKIYEFLLEEERRVQIDENEQRDQQQRGNDMRKLTLAIQISSVRAKLKEAERQKNKHERND